MHTCDIDQNKQANNNWAAPIRDELMAAIRRHTSSLPCTAEVTEHALNVVSNYAMALK